MDDILLSTPPQSPRFDDFYDMPLDKIDLEENTDSEDNRFKPRFVSHCLLDSELNKALKIYVERLHCEPEIHFPDNFSILWSIISSLQINTKIGSEQRTRINNILVDIYASFEGLDFSQTQNFLNRFLYIIKGVEYMTKTSTSLQRDLLHIRLDIITMFLKFVEFHPIFSFNEILELDPATSNPQEYIMEWIFDLLITASSSLCPCYSLLWVLLIRHGEMSSKGWYKYLHAKIVHFHSGRKTITRGCLDSVRGNTGLVNSAGVIDRTRLWNVYWLVLVATAPLYEKTKLLLVDSEDNPPSKDSIRHALQSLLALQEIWGTGVETIRSLWLYFSRKLDSMNDMESKDASSEFSEFAIKFRLTCIFVEFILFIYFVRIRIALPTLTRQGVTNYFFLLENMLEAVSNSPREQKAASELVEFVISLFGGVEEAQLKWSCDWEMGRRCATLEGLQKLLTYLPTDSPIVLEFEKALTRLMQLTSLFREALLRQVNGINEEPTASFSNFINVGWRDKLEQMALSFCKSLLSNLEKKIKWISGVLDTSLIELLCSSEHGDWVPFLRNFLSSLCAVEISCPNNLNVRIWSEIFPQFVSRACTNSLWSKESVEVAVRFLSIALTSSLPETKSPWDILQELVFKTDLAFSFRTKFSSRLFSDSALLSSLLSNSKMDSEKAWQFYTIWLFYKLLSDEPANSSKILLESLSNRGCELPDGVSELLNTSDAEISMSRLCNRFEAAETFQDRMTFKSAILRRLTPLGQLLSSIMESFITPEPTAQSYSDTEIITVYKATASLFQVTAALLYSPDSVFNELFASFLMPPWRHLEKEVPKKTIIQNCVTKNLPAFLRGIAQLNFLKDPFIIRMLRELLRAVFFAVPEGMNSLVSVIHISGPASYRAHLLRVLALEFITYSEKSPLAWSEKAKMWLNFCQKMDDGTMTMAQRLRDAPFLLWPLAALLSDSKNSKSFPSIASSCNSAFSTFTARWKSTESTGENNLLKSELLSLRNEISDELQVIYRLNTNSSVTIFLKEIFKKSGFC